MTQGTLTSFGKSCREIRANKGLRMIDQAKYFDCSPSFISAIENGDKQAPEGYVERFSAWLNLAPETSRQLQVLADTRINVIRFTPQSKQKAEVARRLFRRINTMTPDEIRQLDKSLNGDKQ
jgi:transcriptional regulator with XRE-family HTH domain